MSSVLKRDDQASVVGLVSRQDLNGHIVTLLKWRDDLERWEARCNESGEGVRIKPTNLRKVTRDSELAKELRRFVLDPVLGNSLKSIIRGEHPFIVSGVGEGQITRIAFEPFVSLALEVYRDPPAGITNKEVVTVAMFLDFIGKEGDSELVFMSLKTKLSSAFNFALHGMFLPAPPAFRRLLDMGTAADISTLMLIAREGTLAHIESQQVMLKRLLPHLRGVKIQSDRQKPAKVFQMLFCGSDDNKSMKRLSLKQELIQAAMYGEVTIIGTDGMKSVEVDEGFHRVYVSWLLDDVFPTLRASDARKSSLGEWHRILNWEKQLTSSITVASDHAMLDVSDDFSIDSWLDGFVSFDLSFLKDLPGVDTDRRILRLALFAEWAFKASLETDAWDKMRRGEKPPSPFKDIDEQKPAAFKEGTKVVLVNMDEKNPVLCSGMTGRITSASEPGKYGVSFSNLEQPKLVDAANLRVAEKVQREYHECICGDEGTFRCKRCNKKWYCSSSCQSDDYQRHRKACKVLGSGLSVLELSLKENRKQYQQEMDDESV